MPNKLKSAGQRLDPLSVSRRPDNLSSGTDTSRCLIRRAISKSGLAQIFAGRWAPQGVRSFGVGPLHELVGWLLGRIPLNHSPPANITVDASAVSDGQCGIADEVLRPQYLHMKSPLRAYFEVCIDVLPIVPKFTLQIVGVE